MHRKVKLHTTSTAGLNLFTAYGDDYVAVNHEKHEKNLIVLPESLRPGWSTANVATLQESDMQQLLDLGVEVILLGTGKRLRFPAPALMRPFAPAGIGLEVMDLQAACRTYNILASEGRKVAAALLFD
nr:Mth938-like domain-containing protein [Azonexus fungiphilus]